MRATTLAASLSVLVVIGPAVTASAGGIGAGGSASVGGGGLGASGSASAGGIGASGSASVGGGGIGASGGASVGGFGASGGASVGGFGASGSASVGGTGFGASGRASVGPSAGNGASTNFGGTLSRGTPTFSTTALPLIYAPKVLLKVPHKKLLPLKQALGQLDYRDFRTLKHKCGHVLRSARSFMASHVLVCKIATENLAEVSRRVKASSTQKLDCTEVLQSPKRYGKAQQQVCAIVAARL